MKALGKAWVELWVPTRLWSGESAVQARLRLLVLTVGLVGLIGSCAVFGLIGLWPSAIGSLLLTVAWVGCLFGLRRGAPLSVIGNLAVGAYAIGVVLPFLAAPQPQPDLLAWAVVLPQLGALMVGRRGGLIWAAMAVVVVIIALVLYPAVPHTAPLPGYSSQFTATLRIVLLMSLTMALGWQFHQEGRRTEKTLENANRARSSFLATMSHEIRTPMNGVLGMTEVMLQGPLDASMREQLSLIQRSGHSLVALINDILDFSKVEAGKLRIESNDFDMLELMGDLQQLFEHLAAQKGVQLDLTTLNGVPRVLRGDSLRLRQVLNNLVNNAVKFTPRGMVSLRASCRENTGGKMLVRFEIEDTGVGIAPEVLPRLFTLFEQGDVSTTRRYGGTGLGLALSQQLVALMGGMLAVKSQVGVGSLFSFSLWFERGGTPLVEAPINNDALTRSTHPVLVVDDNAINLRVACGLLEKAGYVTESASNGREALEKVQAHRYALVLMDCHMPVMDGFEATERIRGLDSDASLTPIIALTASALPEELEACRRAGMNDCLTKPVSMKMLQRVLGQVAQLEAQLAPIAEARR